MINFLLPVIFSEVGFTGQKSFDSVRNNLLSKHGIGVKLGSVGQNIAFQINNIVLFGKANIQLFQITMDIWQN